MCAIDVKFVNIASGTLVVVAIIVTDWLVGDALMPIGDMLIVGAQ